MPLFPSIQHRHRPRRSARQSAVAWWLGRGGDLSFERLEDRALLAAAVFNGVELTITGTESSDQIFVSTPSLQSLQIETVNGVPITLDGDTAANPAFVLSGDDQTLTVDIGPSGVSLESLLIDTADGEDEVQLEVQTLSIAGQTLAITIDVGAGNDVADASSSETPVLILGGDGDDMLLGGLGADTLQGGAGNDILAGGQGEDVIDGGDDLDINSFEGIPFGVIATIDEVGGTATYGSVSESFTGIEGIIGTDGDDILTGNSLDNVLVGGGGIDIIDGLGGDDSLAGGEGSDRIAGGLGDDFIDGEGGNDLLLGQEGNDFVLGGLGSDQLVGGAGVDIVDDGPDDVVDSLPIVGAIDLFPVLSSEVPLEIPANPLTPIAVPLTSSLTNVLTVTPVDSEGEEVEPLADAGFSLVDANFDLIAAAVPGPQVTAIQPGQAVLILFEPSTQTRSVQLAFSQGLGGVNLGQALLTNPDVEADVNNDGVTTPLDALVVINELVSDNAFPVAVTPNGDQSFVDVNSDGLVTPLDALTVINVLLTGDPIIETQTVNPVATFVGPPLPALLSGRESQQSDDDVLLASLIPDPQTVTSFGTIAQSQPFGPPLSVTDEPSESTENTNETRDLIFSDEEELQNLLI